MAYKLISVKCPDCGQTLSLEENRTQAFCSYCGAKILISNENEFIVRKIDEAGILKAENEKQIRMREMDLEEKSGTLRKTLTVIWIILTLALLGIAIWIMFSPGVGETPGWALGFLFLMFVCGPVIGGGAGLVFKWLPEKENEKIIQRQGGIRFPDGVFPSGEKKFFEVKETLESVGFTNITCVNLHDLNLITGLISGDKVASITVNGNRVMTGGKSFMPDAPIVISYHGR